MNSVSLIGRLTGDPEIRHTTSNKAVTSFTIAVDRRFQQGQADFINIVAWEKTAEFIAKYFAKGNRIALNGSIQTRQYEDKSGNKRTAVEVLAENVEFCESKQKSTQNADTNNADVSFTETAIDELSDDLPF